MHLIIQHIGQLLTFSPSPNALGERRLSAVASAEVEGEAKTRGLGRVGSAMSGLGIIEDCLVTNCNANKE